MCRKKLCRRRVAIQIDGYQSELGLFPDGKVIKKLLIKRLQDRQMKYNEFVELTAREAAFATPQIYPG
jgi:hypothetical protein